MANAFLTGKEQLVKGGTQFLRQGFAATGNSVSPTTSVFYGYSCTSARDGLPGKCWLVMEYIRKCWIIWWERGVNVMSWCRSYRLYVSWTEFLRKPRLRNQGFVANLGIGERRMLLTLCETWRTCRFLHFINRKFWEELIHFPLIQHGPHRKPRLRQFFIAAEPSLRNNRGIHKTHWCNNYSNVACIRCRGNVFTEPLLRNFTRDTHTDRLIGGIYEIRHRVGFCCHVIHTNFHKDWFRHSKVNGRIHRNTDSIQIA
jgi:hypothetical protein